MPYTWLIDDVTATFSPFDATVAG